MAALVAAVATAGGASGTLASAATPAPTSAPAPTSTPAPTTTPAPTPSPAPEPVTVKVARTTVTSPIAPGFVGFSFEFQAVRSYTGSNPRHINPVLVQLIRNLSRSPVLRIGGNSTDETWWPLPHTQPSPGIKYALNRSWLATTRALAADSGGRLVLGLNLKLDNAAEVAREARAYRAGIGNRYIDALELGNEPELYPITPYYYQEPGGLPVYPRTRTYHFAAYASDASRLTGRLPKATPLAGPASGSLTYLKHLPQLFKAEPNLKMVTYHRYPLITCFTQPGDPGYPTIPNLLNPASSRDLLQGTRPYIALAHKHGATFRLEELNSVACKGKGGVSDTFASALWMLDSLFAVARAGADGVNIHTLPEASYHPFTFTRVAGRWVATVLPEYYGLLMFNRAAPTGSRLLSVSTTPTPDIRARAAIAPTGLTHVVLINDSLTAEHSVVVHLPKRARTALLERLTAPSAEATTGVTIGGQSFGSETPTGTLTGRFKTVHLRRVHGQYVVRMPAASAAMVSFAPASADSAR